MTNQTANVATINTTSGQDPIEAAMDAAIAELDEKDCNGHVAADLIEAREQYREQQRQRAQETGKKPAKLPAYAISDLLTGTDYELGRWITEGQDSNRRHAIRESLLNAAAITDALSVVDHGELSDFTALQLSRIADTAVRRAQHLEAEGISHA